MVDDGTASVQTEGGRRRWLRTPGMPDAKLDGLAGLRRARIRAHADIPPPRLDQHDHDLVQPLFRQQATGDPAPRRRGHRRPERRDEDLRLSRGAEEPVPTDWPGDTRDLVGDGLPARTATQGQPLGAAPGGGASSGLRSRSWISRWSAGSPAGRVALLRRHGEQRARRDHRPARSRRDRHRARRPAGDRNTVASLHAAVIPRLTVSDAAPGGREPGSASTARAASAVTRPARGRSIRQPRSRTPAARPSDEVGSMR
jgi:hypothetical protein